MKQPHSPILTFWREGFLRKNDREQKTYDETTHVKGGRASSTDSTDREEKSHQRLRQDK